MIYCLAVRLPPPPAACSTRRHLHIFFPWGRKMGCWRHKVWLFINFKLLATASHCRGESEWQLVGRHAQGHTKKATCSMGQKSRGLEKPTRQRAPLHASQPRDQQDHSARRGGSPEMLKSLMPDSYSFSGEKIAFWNCPLFSLSHQAGNRLYFLLLIHKY